MIFPDKYESINNGILVLGFRVIQLLRKKELHINQLYRKINKVYKIDMLYFFDIITFLWLLDAVELNFNIISLSNDFKKNIHQS